MDEKKVEQIRQYWINTLDEIVECSPVFGNMLKYKDLTQSNFEDWCYENYEYNLVRDSITFCHGVSRAAIISDDCDYVLKIDFSDKKVNYCERECKIYNQAVKLNIAKFFCEIVYLGTYNNIPLYAMAKAEECEEQVYSNLIEYYESTGLDCDEAEATAYDSDIKEQVYELFCNTYAVEEVDKFFNFCEDAAINDLHGGNIGWISETVPALIDYASYHSWEDR